MGQKQKRESQKYTNSDRIRQKNKTGDIDLEKWNQTGSPEIPDSGETSEIPRPPFGGFSGEGVVLHGLLPPINY